MESKPGVSESDARINCSCCKTVVVGGMESEAMFKNEGQSDLTLSSRLSREKFTKLFFLCPSKPHQPGQLKSTTEPTAMRTTTLAFAIPYALMQYHIFTTIRPSEEGARVVSVQLNQNTILLLTFFKTFPALYCAFKNKANRNVAAAFIFCGIGDILLQLDGLTMNSNKLPSLFIHGLLSFLFAHLLFIHSFGTLKQVFNDIINIEWWTISSYLLVIGAVMILWPFIAADTIMQVAVPVYGLVLATLMNRSYAYQQKSSNSNLNSNSTAAKLVTIGTILFTISDVLIVFDKYKIISLSAVEREIAVMSTYFGALSLISMMSAMPMNDTTGNARNAAKNNARNKEASSSVFTIGTTVNVESRMTPGMNAPGGVGRVTKLNQNGTYNIKYILGGAESNVESMYITNQVFTDTISGAAKKRSRRTSSKGRTSTLPTLKTPTKIKTNKKRIVRTPKSSPSKKWMNHLPKIGRMVDWKFGKDWYTGFVNDVDGNFVTVTYANDDGDDEAYQHKIHDCWPKKGRWRYHKDE